MTDIAEILEKILTAVYGRDVRQSIHDGIEACKDAVGKWKNGVISNHNTIMAMMNEIPLDPISGYVWGISGGTSVIIPATLNSQYTWLNVNPGDAYWVRTSSEADGNAYAPVMLTYGGGVDGTGGIIVSVVNSPYIEGTNDYFVTIPEGSNVDTMLISADEIAVEKIRLWKATDSKAGTV